MPSLSDKHNNQAKKDLRLSYRFCAELTKANSSFYLGLHFAKKHKRDALYSIYAWMRVIDDIADDPTSSIDERLHKLGEFSSLNTQFLRKNTKNLKYEAPFWPAFIDTVHKNSIPITYLNDMLECQKTDLVKFNYDTFNELYIYCQQAASSVGLIFINVFGYEGGRQTQNMAEWCGIAFQLTNILRDINEDKALGRVYLPAEYFEVEHLTVTNFNQISKDQLMQGIKKIIAQTESYYKKSAELYAYLHNDGQFTFIVLYNTYRCLFDKIQANPELLLTGKKIKLQPFEKIKIIIASCYQHALHKLKACHHK